MQGGLFRQSKGGCVEILVLIFQGATEGVLEQGRIVPLPHVSNPEIINISVSYIYIYIYLYIYI